MARTVMYPASMTVLDGDQLDTVCGGATKRSKAPVAAALGRCGPGDKMQFLGNVYTPECMKHDLAIRRDMSKGNSFLKASLKELPLLGPAVASYFRARFA